MAAEPLKFYTRWDTKKNGKKGLISATQEVQISEVPEMMINQFKIVEQTGNHFTIELENASLGKIQGTGIIKEGIIAWEFRNGEIGFEGFEFYEVQEDGTYLMRAEYSTPDHFRTIIRGKIWEKIEQ